MLRLQKDSHTCRFVNLCGILICKIPCNSKILCLNISTLTGGLPCSNSKTSKGNSWAWRRLGVTISSQHADWSSIWSHGTLTAKALAEERKIPDEGYYHLRRFLETSSPLFSVPFKCWLTSGYMFLEQAICINYGSQTWSKKSSVIYSLSILTGNKKSFQNKQMQTLSKLYPNHFFGEPSKFFSP